MNKKMIALVAGSLLVAATSALAANKAETFSVSPMVSGITFDGKQHLQTAPVYGMRAGYNFTKRLGIEALFDYANTKSTLGAGKVDMFRYGGEFLYHMLPDNKFVPYLAAGYGGLNFKGATPMAATNKIKGVADYGVGAKYFFNDDIALRGDVRHLIYSFGKSLHAVEYGVGLYVPFGGAQPAPKPVEVAKPAPVEVVQPKAAPVVAAPLDSDGDGVIDSLDKCPNTPGGVPVQANGCPYDTDNDGVPNYLDKCGGTPAGVAVDSKGCPLDSDRDGVADYLDKCPGTPAGTKVDTNGCPVPVAAAQPKASAAAVKAAERFCNKPSVIKIQFDTNKADVKPQYESDLNVLGLFLKEFPASKGEIDGHTDNVGSKQLNQKLSQRRAESVKKYLVEKYKVTAERIEAKGFGFDKPVASNKTAKGKAQNRRIEANFTCE